jgi:AraC-like DNA-binding protein/quercetin dioxygenase-like cupin family protein
MSRKRHTSDDEPFFVIRAAAADLPGGSAVDHHAHPWPQLIYASAGVMTVWTEAGSWIAPPHWAVWAPANVAHGIRFSGQSAMRTLYVRPQEAAALPARCSVMAVSTLLRELILRTVEIGMLDERIPSHGAMARLILDEVRERPTPSLDLPMPASVAARQAAEQILEGVPACPIAELARRVGLGSRTLERRFAQETGMTLGRWRRQARLLDALRKLGSGQTVKVVAQDAGYGSPSAFVSAFRSVFGVTPARYFDNPQAADLV